MLFPTFKERICGRANNYFYEMENINYHVEAGHIDEEAKLDIFNAIPVVNEFY